MHLSIYVSFSLARWYKIKRDNNILLVYKYCSHLGQCVLRCCFILLGNGELFGLLGLLFLLLLGLLV